MFLNFYSFIDLFVMSFIIMTNNSTKNKDTTEKKDELLLDKHFYIALSMVFFLFAIIFFGWGRN